MFDPSFNVHSLPTSQLEKIQRAIAGLTEAEADALAHDWSFWARPEQLIPDGDWWFAWLFMGGRGAGKTKTGAETIRQWVKSGVRSLGIIGPTVGDTRAVMVEGISGILACSWAGDRDVNGREVGIPEYQPSKRRIIWANGAICYTYSAEEPERLRGPQHEKMWADEIGAWAYAQEAWDMAMFGLRIGDYPQILATTTPRPIPLIKMLVREPTTVRTHSTSDKNRANLAPAFFDTITKKYKGTRLGRQELQGELLEDIPGALFTRSDIERNRVKPDAVPEMRRIVVAVDPSGASGDSVEDDGRNEIGIVGAGVGVDDKCYIFRDATILASPRVWGAVAVQLYRDLGADRIVAESNFGGGMVEFVVRAADRNVPYSPVVASRGKTVRAEPASALLEQNRLKFVGAFPALEDELCSFTQAGYVGDSSPNRGDAMVWAVTELMFSDGYTLTAAALS